VAERTQTFLLHYRLARLAQILISSLQCAVDLSLMRGKGDVFAQLSQELSAGRRVNARRAQWQCPIFLMKL
jgi:hypothetical protein